MSLVKMTVEEARILLRIIGREKFGEFLKEAHGYDEKSVQHAIEYVSRCKIKNRASSRSRTSPAV